MAGQWIKEGLDTRKNDSQIASFLWSIIGKRRNELLMRINSLFYERTASNDCPI